MFRLSFFKPRKVQGQVNFLPLGVNSQFLRSVCQLDLNAHLKRASQLHAYAKGRGQSLVAASAALPN